jgi:hypothetical protein
MRAKLRRVIGVVTVTFVIYAYFLGGYINNVMTNASADLAIALVDDHSLQIDPYYGNSSDVSTRNGHIYSGFGPGLAFLLVPVYVVIKPVIALIPPRYLAQMDQRLYEGARINSPQLRPTPGRTVALLLVVAGTLSVAIPLSIVSGFEIVAMCRRYFPGLTQRELVGLLFLFSFGTIALAFAANLSHTSVAALLIWIASCQGMRLHDGRYGLGRLAAIGFLLGLATIVDYQASLFSLYAGLFLLWLCAPRQRLRAAAVLGLGALPPIVSNLVYNLVAFGSAFTNAYRFRFREADRSIFSFSNLGASLPTPAKLYVGFLGPFSGILLYHPLLVIGFFVTAYCAVTDTDRGRRPFWILGVAMMLTNVAIYSSYPLSVGPGSLPTFAIRYTMYSVPFVIVGLAALVHGWGGKRQWLSRALLVLAVLNALPVWIFLFYGMPVYPKRGYARLLSEIGPGSYTLTKLHEGHILGSAIWGWGGLGVIVALLLLWRRTALAMIPGEVPVTDGTARWTDGDRLEAS